VKPLHVAIAAGAGLAAFSAWQFARQLQGLDQQGGDLAGGGSFGDAGGILVGVGQGAAELADRVTGGALRLSAMARISGADVINPQVQAMLAVIRAGEGTSDVQGYSRVFGGAQFAGFSDHPRRKVTASGYTSTAAGAYQFLASTWDETASIMQLPDFTPASQDRAAVGRIAARNALDDVKAGRLGAALAKLGAEWASLPGSAYGQPTITTGRARDVFARAGGITTDYA
jgi:muramidase (phage lysozyme)